MLAAVRRHEQLASEHQAAVSQEQQLRAQNASLADQVLSQSSQLNTEKVKYEQQLRATRSNAQKCMELDRLRQHLEQQVHSGCSSFHACLHAISVQDALHLPGLKQPDMPCLVDCPLI